MKAPAKKRAGDAAGASGRGRTPAELNNRLFFRMFQAGNTLAIKAAKTVEPLELTSQQWSVIGALSRYQDQGGISVNELSAYLRMSRQNLSIILRRMDEDGSIRRERSAEDQRERRVLLTPKGQEIWRALRKLAGPFHENALEDFTLREREQFLAFLIRFERGLNRS